MNEQIRKMCIDSHLHGYMVHLYTVNAPDGYRVPIDIRMASIERFAQLIVAECVSIVSKRKNQAIDDECNVDEAMATAEMDINEHFGV
jgi:hypothetical protein